MKKFISTVVVTLIQSVFIFSFISLLSIWLREERFEYSVKIGWPKTYFTAFDAGNGYLNHGADLTSLILDFTIVIPFAFILVLLLRKMQ